MLCVAFAAQLADFGFATVFDMLKPRNHTECGTQGYMAPEMLGGRTYDPRLTDLWATGVMLFILMAGFPPFQRARDDDWWFNKLNTGRHALFWQAHCRNAYFSEAAKGACRRRCRWWWCQPPRCRRPDLLNKILTPDPLHRIDMEGIKRHGAAGSACRPALTDVGGMQSGSMDPPCATPR